MSQLKDTDTEPDPQDQVDMDLEGLDPDQIQLGKDLIIIYKYKDI